MKFTNTQTPKQNPAHTKTPNKKLSYPFQLEEKTIELEGARAIVRQFGSRQKTPTEDLPSREQRDHSSMRDMEPVTIPDEPSEEARITETPKRTRPSRIPLHTAPKGSRQPAPRRDSASNSVGPRSRSGESPARPPSSHSVRSVTSVRSRYSATSATTRKDPAKKPSAVPVRRSTGSAPPPQENKVRSRSFWNAWFSFKDSGTS